MHPVWQVAKAGTGHSVLPSKAFIRYLGLAQDCCIGQGTFNVSIDPEWVRVRSHENLAPVVGSCPSTSKH